MLIAGEETVEVAEVSGVVVLGPLEAFAAMGLILAGLALQRLRLRR